MKFNFKPGSKKIAVPNMKQLAGVLGKIWQKIHTTLFFIFLFALIALGAYIWRQSLYNGGWSDEKKQAYLDSRDKGVIFKDADFEKVMSTIQARKEEYSKVIQPAKDVFQSYK